MQWLQTSANTFQWDHVNIVFSNRVYYYVPKEYISTSSIGNPKVHELMAAQGWKKRIRKDSIEMDCDTQSQQTTRKKAQASKAIQTVSMYEETYNEPSDDEQERNPITQFDKVVMHLREVLVENIHYTDKDAVISDLRQEVQSLRRQLRFHND